MTKLNVMIAIAAIATVMFSACDKEPTPPAAVTNLTATAGNAQVVLTWNAPNDNGGEEITAYELTRDNWATKLTKTASELTHTYTGLTNGTAYTFKVRAVNAKGAGAESSATATPTTGSNEPLGDWTLPTNNLKVVWYQSTYNSEWTAIKIGNDYYVAVPKDPAGSNHNKEEIYYKYKPETNNWTAWERRPNINSGNWRVIPAGMGSFGENDLKTRLVSIYGNMTYRTGFTNTPVIGTDIVVGRAVEIRADNLKTVKRYYDTEHKLALKGTSYDGENVMLEVKSWDETVTDFGNIDLPE